MTALRRRLAVRAGASGDEAGFTLLEVISTCLLASILFGLSVGPFREYQLNHEQRGTMRTAVAAMRYAQVAAVSEGVSYRVDVVAGGKELTVSRVSSTTQVVRRTRVSDNRFTFVSPSFVGPSGTTQRATFYPRGSATPGTLDVSRTGSDKVHRITVEGLTARVSYDQ